MRAEHAVGPTVTSQDGCQVDAERGVEVMGNKIGSKALRAGSRIGSEALCAGSRIGSKTLRVGSRIGSKALRAGSGNGSERRSKLAYARGSK